MSYEIKTNDFVTTKKILVDGKEWTMTAPGAGDQLMLGQAQRRTEMIQKKVEAGTATEADLDMYDKLEDRMFSMFARVFKDGTPENTEVKEWLNSTPLVVIYAIMEDIKRQFEDKEPTDGATSQEVS